MQEMPKIVKILYAEQRTAEESSVSSYFAVGVVVFGCLAMIRSLILS